MVLVADLTENGIKFKTQHLISALWVCVLVGGWCFMRLCAAMGPVEVPGQGRRVQHRVPSGCPSAATEPARFQGGRGRHSWAKARRVPLNRATLARATYRPQAKMHICIQPDKRVLAFSSTRKIPDHQKRENAKRIVAVSYATRII